MRQHDAGGISIPADAIDVSASGVKITDIAGNAASVTQAEVADNSAFKVALDTTPPYGECERHRDRQQDREGGA